MDHTGRQKSDRVPPAMMIVLIIVALMAVFLLIGSIRMISARPIAKEESETQDPVTTVDPGTTVIVDLPVFAAGNSVPLPSATDRTVTLAADDSSILAEHAVLIDAETGEILAQKAADVSFSPASMTKVMTLLVICERIRESDLSAKIAFSEEMHRYVHPSDREDGYYGAGCFGFDPGDTVTLKDALFGIGVSSFADCSILAMNYLTDSEEVFTGWMNEEAAAMGLTNTHFDNIIGYDSPENYTTASEIAAILARAIQCPLIREILSTPHYSFTRDGYNSVGEWVTGSSCDYWSTLFNSNSEKSSRFSAYGIKVNGKLTLEKAIFGGGKTGSLNGTSGSTYLFSLASFATAKSGGKTYVAVTGADTVNPGKAPITDAKTLYDRYIP